MDETENENQTSSAFSLGKGIIPEGQSYVPQHGYTFDPQVSRPDPSAVNQYAAQPQPTGPDPNAVASSNPYADASAGMLEQAKGLPDKLWMGSSSEQRQSAELNPQQRALYEGVFSGLRSGVDKASKQVDANANKRHQLFIQSLAEEKTYQAATGGQKDAAAQTLRRQTTEIKDLGRKIDKAQIDPERIWKQMSNTQSALQILAVTAGAFVEGWTRGQVKNRALEMLENSIDRDIAAQRMNLQKMMDQMGFKQRERDVTMSQFNRFEDKQRDSMRTVVRLKFAEASAAARDLDTKARYMDLSGGLAERSARITAMGNEKVTKVKGGHDVLNPHKEALLGGAASLAAKGAAPKEELKDDIKKQLAANDDLANKSLLMLKLSLKGANGQAKAIFGKLAAKMGYKGTEQGYLDAMRNAQGIVLAHAMAPGPVTQKDAEAAMPATFSTFDTKAVRAVKLEQNRQAIRDRWKTAAEVDYPSSRYRNEPILRRIDNAERVLLEMNNLIKTAD